MFLQACVVWICRLAPILSAALMAIASLMNSLPFPPLPDYP